MLVIPLLGRLTQENLLNLGSRGCGELRSRHCTPAWAARVKLHLKEEKKNEEMTDCPKFVKISIYRFKVNNC